METAKKLWRLAVEAGIKRVFAIGNKVSNPSEAALMEKFAADNNIPLLGLIPYDEDISEADAKGGTPLKHAGASEGVVAIQRIGEKLLGLQ